MVGLADDRCWCSYTSAEPASPGNGKLPSPILTTPSASCILTVLADVLAVLDELVAQRLPEVPRTSLKLRQPIYCILREMKAIHVIQHRHIERRGDSPLLLRTRQL